jgi:ABC-type multidrug transport system ATPase subunit
MIGLAGQYAAVDPFLTGRENLELVAELRHLPPGQYRRDVDLLLERLGLAGAAGRLVRVYSGGMCRRLDLAARSWAGPGFCFLTSRQPAWIRAAGGSYGISSPNKSRMGPPSC